MKKQIVKDTWLKIESDLHGDTYIPRDLVGEDFRREDVKDYIDYPVGKVDTLTEVVGYGARMSAPGYTDCTEWCVFESEEEAETYLDDMYGEE